MLQINVLSLFPNLFTEHLNNLPFKRAIDKKIIDVKIWNLRDYALDAYGTVDDKPYGGGVGMLLMIEPIYNALTDILGKDFDKHKEKNGQVIVLSPRGKTFTQKLAQDFTAEQKITFICGRYEGMDARIEEYFATDVISVGNYVVSGGELPALTIMESITRLMPEVLEKSEATKIESFSEGDNIEYSQYTRPEDFKGYKVPKILLSGNHKEISQWRNNGQTNPKRTES